MDDPVTQRDLEAQILLWIARLPLIRRYGLDWLTGAAEADVDAANDLLRRLGWIDQIGIPYDAPPAERGFVLRDAAVGPFARACGLDERAVRRDWPVGRAAIRHHIARYPRGRCQVRRYASWTNSGLRNTLCPTAETTGMSQRSRLESFSCAARMRSSYFTSGGSVERAPNPSATIASFTHRAAGR